MHLTLLAFGYIIRGKSIFFHNYAIITCYTVLSQTGLQLYMTAKLLKKDGVFEHFLKLKAAQNSQKAFFFFT